MISNAPSQATLSMTVNIALRLENALLEAIVVTTKPSQQNAPAMRPARTVNMLRCRRIPYSTQAMMISARNTKTKGAAIAKADLLACSALHCSTVFPCAAIHPLAEAGVVDPAENPRRDGGDKN